MPDFLSIFERTLKAVRFGIFQASDQLALALDGLCRAPEVYPRYEMTAPGSFVIPDSAASPKVAVVAPSPKQGSDSPPRDSAIPPAPSGGTQITLHRTELIPNGHGAYIGFSNDFPGKQFLVIPQK